MAATRVKCKSEECFQNDCGKYCKLLTRPIHGNCPFFKTHADAEIGRQEAHERLKKIGRYDLIEQYEYNGGRDW